MRQKIYKIIEFVPNHVLYDLFTMQFKPEQNSTKQFTNLDKAQNSTFGLIQDNGILFCVHFRQLVTNY